MTDDLYCALNANYYCATHVAGLSSLYHVVFFDWLSVLLSNSPSEVKTLTSLRTLSLREATWGSAHKAFFCIVMSCPNTSFIFLRETWAPEIPPVAWVMASCIGGSRVISLLISASPLCNCSWATSARGLKGRSVVWLSNCWSLRCLLCLSSFFIWCSKTLHLVHSWAWYVSYIIIFITTIITLCLWYTYLYGTKIRIRDGEAYFGCAITSSGCTT